MAVAPHWDIGADTYLWHLGRGIHMAWGACRVGWVDMVRGASTAGGANISKTRLQKRERGMRIRGRRCVAESAHPTGAFGDR